MHAGKSRRSRVGALALGALVSVTLAGCDSLLEVDLPGSTTADAVDDPSYASLLVLSAQGDFECAYNNWVFNSANLAGELLGANGTLVHIPIVTRNVQSHHTAYGQDNCGNGIGLYTPLSTARFVAENAFTRITEWPADQVSNRERHLGRTALYAGFTYTAFGMAFCSAAFDLGPELMPNQMLQLAVDRFTTAIEWASQAGDAPTVNAAYVGRARARLQLGELAAAAADAGMVPAGFRMDITRSNAQNRRQNSIFTQNVNGTGYTIDPYYWDVRWQDVPDPRVGVVNANRLAGNARTPLWRTTKYPDYGTPIRLASYTEAQLIIAEVEGGQTAVDIINALHAAADIPPFESSDPEEIRAQVIEERRREFFLEGLRMGDLRRTGEFSQWNRADEVNPWTFFAFGGTECFPLPDVERRNNPNIS